MDAAIVVALTSLAATPIAAMVAHWLGRRKVNVDIEGAAAAAAEQVRAIYSKTMTDMRAMLEAAAADVESARIAAREAQARADEAERNAWRAQRHAGAMELFLVEIRPLIVAHIPHHEQLVRELDRLVPSHTPAP